MDEANSFGGRLARYARVGGTGIGYFVWNEWNNLSITNVIVSILVIGITGMMFDQILGMAQQTVTFPE